MLHSNTTTSIILPRLSAWAQQLAPGERFPSLENFFAKSRYSTPLDADLDRLRLKLFGLQADGETPVAALSRLALDLISSDDKGYYLRLDPVTLQADMSRVMLIRSGFAGFPVSYQQSVQEVVQQVMLQPGETEALDLQAVGDYWTIRLPVHPGVSFTSLDEALGADVSESLPEGIPGRYWKRLQNEIQMALHASEANERRRQRGAALINSVWFWGGGSLPQALDHNFFEWVYSADPVSRGMATLQGMQAIDLQDLPANGRWHDKANRGSILVDWAVPPSSSVNASQVLTPENLEVFCTGLITQLKQQGGRVCLHSPEGSWCLRARDLWRFWPRLKPLSKTLAGMSPR